MKGYIQAILSGPRLKGWLVEEVQYDVMKARYFVECVSGEGKSLSVPINTEWVDQIDGDQSFTARRQIKSTLKQRLKVDFDDGNN